MRLVSLRLENYRRFALAELDFPDGVTGLVGRNGAGKSTLLEAIGWALYGHEAARTDKSLLKRRGATGDCRVRLCFELGGVEHEVTRELAGRTQQHQATLKVGGRVAVSAGANSAKEVTEAVTRALRMDREAFFTSLVARQRELQALADLTPGRRKEVIMRMLRIDAVDEAVRLARDDKRQLEAALQGLAGLQADPATLAAQAEELRKAHVLAIEAEAKAAKAVEATEASLHAIARARVEAEALRQRHDVALEQRNLAASRAEAASRAAAQRERDLLGLAQAAEDLELLAPHVLEHAQLRESVEGLEGLRVRHANAQRLRAEIGDLERQLEEAMRQHEQAVVEAAQAPAARAEMERLRQERATAEALLAEQRAHLATLLAATKDARDRMSQGGARRAELEALGTKAACPTCERPLAEALPRLLSRLEQEQRDVAKRLQELAAQRGVAEHKVRAGTEAATLLAAKESAAKQRAEQTVRREAEVALLVRRLTETRTRLDARRAELTGMGIVPFDEAAYLAQKKRFLELTRSHERALQLRARLEQRETLEGDLVKLRADATAHQREAQAAEAARIALNYDVKQRAMLEERWLGLQTRAREEAVAVERAAGTVQRLAEQRGALALRQAEQEQLAGKVAELRAEVGLLERIAGDRDNGLLPDFRAWLMARLRPSLAERAGELFRLVTEGKYQGLQLSEDYDLLVEEDGQAFPLERFSGGEADAANLCLRIAIGELLAERSGEQLGFLALDEVLASQDDGRRQNILQALAHLQGRFRQILLVTHLAEVQDQLERVVYVRDGPDGSGRLETLEAMPMAA